MRFRDIYDSNSRVDIMTESQSSYNIFHLKWIDEVFQTGKPPSFNQE
jgi:hypothetical protein